LFSYNYHNFVITIVQNYHFFMKKRREKIKELEENLPWGSKKEISKITGLTERTIGNFFKGQSVRLVTMKKIIDAANEIIKKQDKLLKSL